ncbi:MCE family protein [Pseudonocardia sp. Ae168_Ps1]|nr:MCE family protein [Pseudonocardia sp. Ae150A_Ps1]OLL80635.1 MCE family protein [Pseudonocardia sp. Ae168_Ps1]OLL85237.1 MCE family protein [Pseudonocardia sp. Ae263_Ps1]OLL94738.1 MCE family protein [Pseudonocardia sp. Ae356_Ps1]
MSLLGERFLDLRTGDPAAPELPMDGVIGVDRTGQEEDLQNILDTLDDPTAGSLAALVTTLGQGTANNGENVQKTLAALGPAMTDTDQLVSVLADQNELLGRVVDQVEPVTGALAVDEGRRLDGLVASTTSLLGTTAARDAQLRGTLQELPGTLAAARATLGELAGTAQSTSVTLGNPAPDHRQPGADQRGAAPLRRLGGPRARLGGPGPRPGERAARPGAARRRAAAGRRP